MTKNQFRLRLLVIAPAMIFLAWHEGLLNDEPKTILLLIIAVVVFLFALFDIRNDKQSNSNQQINDNSKE